MRFGFLITARCNASCAHCTVDSGPHRVTELPRDKMLDLLDQAARIWQREGEPGDDLEICISGGEPFLDFARLLDIVSHGARLGAQMSCVTNGSWAANDEKASAHLRAVRHAGLVGLGVSTSRFHGHFINRDRVQRVLDLAPRFGLKTTLKCAVTASDQAEGGLVHWAQTRKADATEVFPVMPYLRSGVRLPETEYIQPLVVPRGTCPAPTLTVREDGGAYTCCMPGGFVDFLKLGNAFDSSLARLRDRFYLGGVQQVLREHGPAHFADAIQAAGLGDRLRPGYEGVCDLCAHIGSDAQMAKVAQRAAGAFAKERLQAEAADSD